MPSVVMHSRFEFSSLVYGSERRKGRGGGGGGGVEERGKGELLGILVFSLPSSAYYGLHDTQIDNK